MRYLKEDIIQNFRALGLGEGDFVCVHSSLKSIGEVDGGADTIIEALIEVLGDEGTLMFPAFSFGLLNEENPLWSYEDTPSCVGYLSERFRQKYATKRSIHLSHSYSAIGKDVEQYLEHPLDITPCGEETPLARLMSEERGKILMIGCSYNTLTAIHVIEEAFKVPYVKFKSTPHGNYSKDGVIKDLPSQSVYPFSYDFERLAPYLEGGDALTQAKVGDAPTMLISGVGLTRIASELLTKDLAFFDNRD